MTSIDSAIAASAYADGMDPIEWAVQIAAAHIETRDLVWMAREDDPTAYPTYVGEPTSDAAARRIIASILNAGWKPPTRDEVRDAVLRRAERLRKAASDLRRGALPPDLVELIGEDALATAEQRNRLADALERDANGEAA